MAIASLLELVARAEESRCRVLAAAAGLPAEQETWQPTPDDWSVQAIVEHLVLAEQSGVRFVWRAAEGVRSSRTAWQGEPVHRGLSIETVIARTWRFKEEAPPNARPQQAAPLAYWCAALAAGQPVLEALRLALQGLDLETVIFPHFISGPLDARQRLEFLRWHMDHHREQLEAVRAAMP